MCITHRTGVACGECSSSGYALAHTSTDCIKVKHCSGGMTKLVVVLICLQGRRKGEGKGGLGG